MLPHQALFVNCDFSYRVPGEQISTRNQITNVKTNDIKACFRSRDALLGENASPINQPFSIFTLLMIEENSEI